MSDVRETLAGRDCLLIDLDGVVYAGDAALPGAVEALDRLRAAGKRLAFLTNNSSRAPASLVAKLRRLGIDCDEHEMISSGAAAVEHLRRRPYGDASVYVAGSEELRAFARDEGLTLADPAACDVLLVGLDTRFNYEALAAGLRALIRGVPFIICNRDSSYPGDGGHRYPGCGAMVAAFEAASERRADLDIGKPNSMMFEIVCERFGVTARDCVVIGDSIESDMELARRVGVPGVLVQATDGPRGDAVVTIEGLGHFAGIVLSRHHEPPLTEPTIAAQSGSRIRP